MKVQVTLGASALAIAAVAAGAAPAMAQTAAEFYKNKEIRMIIGSTPGGGYDTYSRMLIRHMIRHVPGKPSKIIPVNMPAAGGIRAFQYINSVAPKDGTAMMIVRRGIPFSQLLDPSTIPGDVSKMGWICNLSDSNPVLVTWHTSPTKTLADAKQRVTLVGGDGKYSITTQVTAAYNRLLDTKFKVLYGYLSGGGVNLAMERGEIEGRATQNMDSWRATKPDWIRDKKLNFILQLGLKKERDLQDVPLLQELVAGDKEKSAVARLLALAHVVGRPLAVAGGVPLDRVAALREACDMTVKDAEFMAEAEKQKAEIGYMPGAEVEALMKELLATPPSMVATMKTYLEPRNEDVEERKATLINASIKVTKTNEKGNRLEFTDKDGKDSNASVHSKRTEVTVDGKKAKRTDVKAGMSCQISYEGAGSEAKKLDCKQ